MPTNDGKKYDGQLLQNKMADGMDLISDFEEFCAHLSPSIRRDLCKGMTEKQILEKYKPVAAARLASIAGTSSRDGVALAAAKDVLDRTSGKAVERKDVTHRMGSLPERELDSLIMSELEDVKSLTTPKETK